MDVGYYISELLGQHGDVNVPGLGYFAHTRVNGFYHDSERKFYPPGYSVQYDPQYLDDDEVLAQYMAEKKKISVASAKYFTEKFVAALKQQAALGEAALADLGWFSVYNTHLTFKSNTVTSTDPEFFGLPAISLPRKGQEAAPAPAYYAPEPENTAPVSTMAEAPSQYLQKQLTDDEYRAAQEQEEYLIELTTKKRRKTTWIFVVLALLLTAGIAFLVQRYDPSTFNLGSKPAPKKDNAPQIVMMPDKDTVIRNNEADEDSVVMSRGTDNNGNVSGTIATNANTDPALLAHYEILAASYKNEKLALAAIKALKNKGVEAKILKDNAGTGPLVKVTIGVFQTRGEAEDQLKELLATQIVDDKARTLEVHPSALTPTPTKP